MKNFTFSPQTAAGQKVMAGFSGTRFNRELAHLIADLKIGGVILFSRNIKSHEQLESLCRDIQAFAAEHALPPLFIAIDQEGGQVARLKTPFEEFSGNPSISTRKAARELASAQAAQLQNLHINMNLAPVMDVVPPGSNGVMQERVFPGSPEDVAALGCRVIETLQENRVMAVAKHFPGIGRTTADSHKVLPEVAVDEAVLQSEDLIPFVRAVQSGVSGIMLSHILYTALDPDWQASLSPRIADGLLRQKMGFSGLVITDDLNMKAVAQETSVWARQIVRSQIDIALICHKKRDIENMLRELTVLMEGDKAFSALGAASFDRILEKKAAYL